MGRAPDITHEYKDGSGDCLVFDDFDGYSNTAWMSEFEDGDEFVLPPQDDVVCCVRMFDNGEFLRHPSRLTWARCSFNLIILSYVIFTFFIGIKKTNFVRLSSF